MRHPEWWAVFFSLVAWGLLVGGVFSHDHVALHLPGNVYCAPSGIGGAAAQRLNELQYIQGRRTASLAVLTIISSGLVPWAIMVAAMMFPLLKGPVRHTAFSVRRKDRALAVFTFLAGYLITWTAAGLSFLLLPLLAEPGGEKTPLVTGLIKASGFALAAALSWLPGRPVRMMKCAWTMPIRIQGSGMLTDCLNYGLKMGLNCIIVCWAPMAALMLAHHNTLLMYEVTVVLVCERYVLPHASRLPGYAWSILAFVLLGIEVWA